MGSITSCLVGTRASVAGRNVGIKLMKRSLTKQSSQGLDRMPIFYQERRASALVLRHGGEARLPCLALGMGVPLPLDISHDFCRIAV
jgi:hypothetical protein